MSDVPGASRARQGVNLLEISLVRGFVRWRGFPAVFQLAMLAAFLGFVALGWNRYVPDGVPAKLYAKSNLVNLVIWGLWWPLMVWAAVAFGRVWCSICPLELVAGQGERAGRKFGIRQRHLSGWLRAGWLILALYAVIQLLVFGIGLHRTPAYTAWFLLAMLATALLTGLFWMNRAYCRGFCPVGLFLGTYERGSMLSVRTDHEPVSGDPNWATVARSCPSLLNPPKLDSSKDCLVCGQCIKASEYGEMAILLRRPFHRDNAREAVASWPVTLFVMLVSGFVTYELTTNWQAGKEVFLRIPSAVGPLLGLSASNGWVGGIWRLFAFPLALWTILGGLVLLLRGAPSLGQAWRRIALPAVPVIAAGRMAKGLEKIATWGGYLPRAIEEPLGVHASAAYAAKTLPAPPPWISMPALSAVGLGLVVVAFLFALRELRLTDARGYSRRAAPIVALSALFGLIVLRWGIWA